MARRSVAPWPVVVPVPDTAESLIGVRSVASSVHCPEELSVAAIVLSFTPWTDREERG